MSKKVERAWMILLVVIMALALTNYMNINEHKKRSKHDGSMAVETVEAHIGAIQTQVDNLREGFQGLVTLKASVLESQVEQEEQKAVIDKLEEER